MWVDRMRMLSMYGIAFTLAFSFLNLNSAFIMLLAVVWLLERNFKEKWILLSRNVGFFAYAFYFLILLLGIFDAQPLSAGWKYIETKVGFLVLPILLCSTAITAKQLRSIMITFLISLTAASLYCLVKNGLLFVETKEASVFFYHSLVAPIHHHAVYFSIFLFVAAIFLFREINAASLGISRWLKIVWLVFCVFVLILLSSKMVLIFLLAYLAFSVFTDSFRMLKNWHKILGLVFVATILVILFELDNPVKRRFEDIMTPPTHVLKEKFNKATYFNGVEFRLLLWRITYDIVKENDAWIMGVGPTNAQTHLNQKYLELNMYSGDIPNQGTGYLIYNCHNQFLQTLLQSGIIGLIALVLLYTYLLIRSFRTNDQVLIAFVLLLLCFTFVESLFERQYGMLMIAWLPLLFICSKEEKKRRSTRKTSSV